MSPTTMMAPPPTAFEEQVAPALKVRGYWGNVVYRLRHDKVTMFFGFILLLIVLAAIFAPLVAPFDPYKESIVGRLKPFGWRSHLLGTDELGRDLLTRLLYGGRISLLMGVVPVLIATVVGGTLGVVGGFGGSRGFFLNCGIGFLGRIQRGAQPVFTFRQLFLGGGLGGGQQRTGFIGVPISHSHLTIRSCIDSEPVFGTFAPCRRVITSPFRPSAK